MNFGILHACFSALCSLITIVMIFLEIPFLHLNYFFNNVSLPVKKYFTMNFRIIRVYIGEKISNLIKDITTTFMLIDIYWHFMSHPFFGLVTIFYPFRMSTTAAVRRFVGSLQWLRNCLFRKKLNIWL